MNDDDLILPADDKSIALDQAFTAFVFAEDWADYKAALREHEALLLSDAALSMLDRLIDALPQMADNRALASMQAHRRLLQRCREIGVEEALAEVAEAEGLADTPLDLAMQAFLDADSVEESRAVAEEHAELLLTPEADEWLAEQIAFATEDGDKELVTYLDQERQVLATMREIGIDAFCEVVDTTMSVISALPAVFREAMAGDMRGRKAFIRELRPMFKTLEHDDPFRPFLKEMTEILKSGSAADAEEYLVRYEAYWG